MPSPLTNERAKAIAREYCANGHNKTNALKAIKNEKGEQYYADSYCQSGRGHMLYNNERVKAEIERIEADLAAESQFTREKQLKDLEDARKVAKNKENAAAMVAATREQNEMLGYHRENAPNAEKEAKRRESMTAEQRRLSEIKAHIRTDQEASKKPAAESKSGVIAKIGA